MKLHYAPLSTNSRKARIAAALLDLPLDLVPVDLPRGEQRGPEFLAKNPMGRVPLLDDEGFLLSESAAILIYLAEKRPGTSLYPTEPRRRAEVHQWLFWGAGHWSPAAAAITFENLLKPLLRLGEPDPVQVRRQEEALRSCAAVLDARLASREWVCGAQLTLADVAIAPTLDVAAAARLPLEPYANIQRWHARVQTLDAWKQTEPPPFPLPKR